MHIEPDGPVFDIVNIVLGAGGQIAVAAKAVDLRPAGHAGLHDVAREVVGNILRELIHVKGPLGPRAHEAHVAAEHVPVLRQFVEVPPADESADPE